MTNGILQRRMTSPFQRIGIGSCFQSWSRVQLFATPMDQSTPGFPALHYLPEFAQTRVHWVGDAFQPSHALMPPSPPAVHLSQIRVFSNVLALQIRWLKNWSFSISPSNEYSGLIFFRIDWFILLVVQEILKSLLQHHNLKASKLCFLGSVFSIRIMSFPKLWYF